MGLGHPGLGHPTRFTKRTFVREKNTQNIDLYVLIQNVSEISNFLVALLSRQRPPNGCHFSFSSRISLIIFFCLFTTSSSMSQLSANHATSPNKNIALRSPTILFLYFHYPPMRSKSHSKWKMASIWRSLNEFWN